MKLYLARHGETDWNRRRWVQGSTDTELNAVGMAQAEQLGETLAAEGIVRVYTSAMRRAGMTAQIVAARLGVPCEVRPGLQEIGLGEWEGHSWPQIRAGWPEAYAAWNADRLHVRPPQGESYGDLLARFVPAVTGILRAAEGDVLVVTHSACMLAFQAELNRTPLVGMERDYAAPNARAIAFDAARILRRWPE